MRRLDLAGNRFYEPVQILGGPKTRARIQRTSDGDQPGVEFATPKTVLRVGPDSLIQTGQVVELKGGDKHLVADHSTTGEYTTHHLFKTDKLVSWTRPVTETDPITNQPRKGGPPQSMGSIWVMWERTRREFMDLSIRIAQENYLVATGADVQLGDYLDGKLVVRRSRALGINIVELRG